ncbi:30S ribosomal protein S9 [Candidatus Peregrinibacteria bacterium]|nr:30S ribosomal protein S9 [Candidatus Peregrinibacteria bacterium]
MSDSKKQYFGSVGKRKTAIARIKLYQSGTGAFTVNGMPLKVYFTGVQIENAVAPLALIGAKTGYDLDAYVVGGGKMSQSDAVRHGVTRALLLANPDIRSDLKRAGFLRRDSRIKERKKPGLRRARRAPQFSKR